MTAQRRHLQHQAVQHIYQSGIVRVHRSGTGATGDKEEPVALLRMQRHYGGEQLTELLVSQRLHMAHHKGAAVTHQGGTVTRHQIFPAGAHEHGTVNLDERRVRKRPFGVEHLHHLGLGCARFTVNDKWAIALQILLQCQVGGGERLGDADGVTLLPEIHASYGEKVYEKLAAKGYAVYDFFLPGLMIDALERGSADTLAAWAQEILDKHILTVNMLGCHDGIPMLDLKGLLPEERIQNLIDLIVTRGGMVKNLHGQKNVYYQVNATYYSALGESDAKLLLARAIQLFMPGKPQVWYLDLFAGKNDCEAVARAGEGGHKEINRTNLTKVQIAEALEKPVVKKQLELLRLRRNCPAFAQGAKVQIESCGPELTIEWSCSGHVARLQANLQKLTYRVEIE